MNVLAPRMSNNFPFGLYWGIISPEKIICQGHWSETAIFVSGDFVSFFTLPSIMQGWASSHLRDVTVGLWSELIFGDMIKSAKLRVLQYIACGG